MGGNYQILHIQIVKKLPVDGYLLSASGGPPYTSPNWELARKMRVKLPRFHGTLSTVLDIYVKGPKYGAGQND